MQNYMAPTVQADMADILSRKEGWNDLEGKTILVTGANGMLATYMVYFLAYLREKVGVGVSVIALVRNGEKGRKRFDALLDRDGFTLLIQDVCSPIAIEGNLDYIVHAASNASPKYILTDPVGIIQANLQGLFNVLSLAKGKGGVRVLYTSTREVYGKAPDGVTVIDEQTIGPMDFTELRACYPESKRMCECILTSYQHQYGVPFIVTRIAHAYGPGMEINEDGRVMADFISDVVHGRNITLHSDGTAERAFCYITDAVAGMFVAMLDGKDGEAYNVANESEPVAIRDAAQMLCDLYPERGVQVVFDIPEQQSQAYSRIGRTKLTMQKLEALGWSCKIPLRDGLKRTVNSFVLEQERKC